MHINKKLIQQVKENSLLLDNSSIDVTYGDRCKGKYVVFHKGKYTIVDSFSEAVDYGLKVFGKDVGFVVRQIGNVSHTLSTLVTV